MAPHHVKVGSCLFYTSFLLCTSFVLDFDKKRNVKRIGAFTFGNPGDIDIQPTHSNFSSRIGSRDNCFKYRFYGLGFWVVAFFFKHIRT